MKPFELPTKEEMELVERMYPYLFPVELPLYFQELQLQYNKQIDKETGE